MCVLDSSTSSQQLPIPVQVALTSEGKPIDWYVNEQIGQGRWHEEVVPAATVGLSRSLTICRAPRRSNLITHSWFGDRDTFCPPTWWDLAIGSGPCGLGCRACFLLLTHRIRRDPWRHLLYDNGDDFAHSVEHWLADPERRAQHTLGVGIDRSDSLLYEGVVSHVQQLAPLFASQHTNPGDCKLILLTKSTNTHYLANIPPAQRTNVIVSFSLNPESVADLWEGKWPNGTRITPSIAQRLEAAALAQELGYEVRARIDPILTPAEWPEYYIKFVEQVHQLGLGFSRWTLGTYREKNAQLQAWAERWGLAPMEWQPGEEDLVQDGTHRHLSPERRIKIYRVVRDAIRTRFSSASIGLCKETHTVRKTLNLHKEKCNCLR